MGMKGCDMIALQYSNSRDVTSRTLAAQAAKRHAEDLRTAASAMFDVQAQEYAEWEAISRTIVAVRRDARGHEGQELQHDEHDAGHLREGAGQVQGSDA
jgi:hypothetical protein